MTGTETISLGYVAAALAAVTAGYPVIWLFFTRYIDRLQARIKELSDQFQEVLLAREDARNAELHSLWDAHAEELRALREQARTESRELREALDRLRGAPHS